MTRFSGTCKQKVSLTRIILRPRRRFGFVSEFELDLRLYWIHFRIIGFFLFEVLLWLFRKAENMTSFVTNMEVFIWITYTEMVLLSSVFMSTYLLSFSIELVINNWTSDVVQVITNSKV